MKIENAQKSVEHYADLLATTAREFAKGKATFEELAEVAKKHTNAVHALGRAAKAVKK